MCHRYGARGQRWEWPFLKGREKDLTYQMIRLSTLGIEIKSLRTLGLTNLKKTFLLSQIFKNKAKITT